VVWDANLSRETDLGGCVAGKTPVHWNGGGGLFVELSDFPSWVSAVNFIYRKTPPIPSPEKKSHRGGVKAPKGERHNSTLFSSAPREDKTGSPGGVLEISTTVVEVGEGSGGSPCGGVVCDGVGDFFNKVVWLCCFGSCLW